MQTTISILFRWAWNVMLFSKHFFCIESGFFSLKYLNISSIRKKKLFKQNANTQSIYDKKWLTFDDSSLEFCLFVWCRHILFFRLEWEGTSQRVSFLWTHWWTVKMNTTLIPAICTCDLTSTSTPNRTDNLLEPLNVAATVRREKQWI